MWSSRLVQLPLVETGRQDSVANCWEPGLRQQLPLHCCRPVLFVLFLVVVVARELVVMPGGQRRRFFHFPFLQPVNADRLGQADFESVGA